MTKNHNIFEDKIPKIGKYDTTNIKIIEITLKDNTWKHLDKGQRVHIKEKYATEHEKQVCNINKINNRY